MIRPTSPALAPWVEYLKRLPLADRAVMLWELKRIGVELPVREGR